MRYTTTLFWDLIGPLVLNFNPIKQWKGLNHEICLQVVPLFLCGLILNSESYILGSILIRSLIIHLPIILKWSYQVSADTLMN